MPLSCQLTRLSGGQLALRQSDGEPVAIRVVRCFPWTRNTEFLSLRTTEGEELALVKDLADLDAASQSLLKAELADTGMTFVITRIHQLNKELELRCWEVDTRQGARSFQTELDEWPLRLPDGRYLIRDVCGDLYTVEDLDRLDTKSRERLWVLLD